MSVTISQHKNKTFLCLCCKIKPLHVERRNQSDVFTPAILQMSPVCTYSVLLEDMDSAGVRDTSISFISVFKQTSFTVDIYISQLADTDE